LESILDRTPIVENSAAGAGVHRNDWRGRTHGTRE
jgi:hypothetical protein